MVTSRSSQVGRPRRSRSATLLPPDVGGLDDAVGAGAEPTKGSCSGVEFSTESVDHVRGRGQDSFIRRVRVRAFVEKFESEGVANWLKFRIEFRDDQRVIHFYLTGRRPAQRGRHGSRHARGKGYGRQTGERQPVRDATWRLFEAPTPRRGRNRIVTSKLALDNLSTSPVDTSSRNVDNSGERPTVGQRGQLRIL